MASLFQRMKKNATGLYRDPLKEKSHEILLHLFGQIFRRKKYKISTRHGSGSFYNQAKIARKTFIPTVL